VLQRDLSKGRDHKVELGIWPTDNICLHQLVCFTIQFTFPSKDDIDHNRSYTSLTDEPLFLSKKQFEVCNWIVREQPEQAFQELKFIKPDFTVAVFPTPSDDLTST
jgi:hypothetical protein